MDKYCLAASGERSGLWDWDLASNRVHFSPRWISMVGCEESEIGNSPEEWFRRVHADDQPRVRRDLEAHLASGASDFDIHHRMRQRNGTYRWMTCRGIVVRDDRGAAVRLVGAHADVTADHVADPLTGLPNRVLFLHRLGESIERARRSPDFLYAVVLIDVERPNPEDASRQADHDPLLTASARRLETCLRGDDPAPFPGQAYVVARLRGPQFAVLLDGLGRIGDALAAAERMLAALLAPAQLRGHQVFPRASVGIAVSASGYSRAEDVMRDADAALYRARSLGGNRCEVFDLDIVHLADARVALEAELQQAVDRHEFLLVYQPVVEAASNRIVGLEALTRWQHPTRGLIPPDEFIPIAEQTGIIVDLGNWTMGEACRQLKTWQAGLPNAGDVWVSVNLSSPQFSHPGLVERVSDILRETDLDPSCLMLELTESVVMSDPEAVKTRLMQLRVMGVRIGIDDFGTGHSSFAYLHQFPADFLKVDQSFIRGMETRCDKAEIVGTMASLAEQLGLRVIAEGIESQAGLELVRSRRCEYLQGFLFSRPVDAAAAAELLRSGLPPPVTAITEGTVGPAERDVTPTPLVAGGRPSVRRNRLAYVALSAVAVLATAGIVTRSASRTVPPIAPMAAGEVHRPVATPVDPSVAASAATGATRAPSSTPATSSTLASAAKTTATTQPSQGLTLTVEHQHVLGGCKGVLRVSASGVTFAPENGKDAFTFRYAALQSSVSNDTLTIKSDKKSYRFKTVRRPGKTGGQRQLQRAATAIAGFHAK